MIIALEQPIGKNTFAVNGKLGEGFWHVIRVQCTLVTNTLQLYKDTLELKGWQLTGYRLAM